MISIAPGNQTVDPPRRSRALGVPRWLPRPTLNILRLLPLIPALLVTVLLAAALTGDDGAVATLKQNAAGINGHRLAMAPDQAFLAAGTLATLLLVPSRSPPTGGRCAGSAATGSDWKRLHRLAYVVLALVTLHLILLPGGPRGPGS